MELVVIYVECCGFLHMKIFWIVPRQRLGCSAMFRAQRWVCLLKGVGRVDTRTTLFTCGGGGLGGIITSFSREHWNSNISSAISSTCPLITNHINNQSLTLRTSQLVFLFRLPRDSHINFVQLLFQELLQFHGHSYLILNGVYLSYLKWGIYVDIVRQHVPQ